MDSEFPALEPPLCSELKHLCKRLQEAYRELTEDLTPLRDDHCYCRWGGVGLRLWRACGAGGRVALGLWLSSGPARPPRREGGGSGRPTECGCVAPAPGGSKVDRGCVWVRSCLHSLETCAGIPVSTERSSLGCLPTSLALFFPSSFPSPSAASC